MEKYPNDSITMCRNYENLFLEVLSKKSQMGLAERKKKFKSIYMKERFVYKKYFGDG